MEAVETIGTEERVKEEGGREGNDTRCEKLLHPTEKEIREKIN